MILASGICNDVDTFVCVDKGMYRIGNQMGLNMAYVKEEYFNRNTSNFFTFESQLCDEEILIKEKKKYKDLDVSYENLEEE